MTDKRGRRTGIAAAAGRRAESSAPAPGGPAARAKPVHMSVDIPPELHLQLTAWTRDQMIALNLTRLTISDAIRAMIRVTIDDDATAAAVRAQMEADRQR
jgi:hypothetical protein